ncbi:MAG: hypothetical protein ACI9UJ_001523 [bacterium]|jgi:hypothetical protein
MKNICLSLVLIAAAGMVVAQTSYPCVVESDNEWKLSNFDVDAGVFETTTESLGTDYSRNTFVKYAGEEQYAYASFDGTSSTIHIRNEAGGHFKSTRLYDHMLSLNFVESKNKMVYLATSKVPNYYDFLSEDVSITILDLVDNTSLKVKIPTFSIFVPTLPFVGEANKKDLLNFNQKHNFAISLPTVNTDKSEFVFIAKDIPGFNRMVKLDLNTNKTRTVAVHVEALSLTYCSATKTLKALVIEKDASTNATLYYVVDINDVTGEATNKVLLDTQLEEIKTEQNGTIQYDVELNKLFVSKIVNGESKFYELDAESNMIEETTVVTKNADIFVPQKANKDFNRLHTLANNIKIFPNPTPNMISIESVGDMLVDKIVLMDATGKVLRNISVQSGLVTNQINVSNIAQGVYYLKVSSGSETHVKKIVKY